MVTIRRLKQQLYPCNQCRFRNSEKFPNTVVHGLQQRTKAYLPNLKSGKELGIGRLASGYAETIGECPNYEKLT